MDLGKAHKKIIIEVSIIDLQKEQKYLEQHLWSYL